MQVDTKLTKTSQVLTDLTSPALTPYYSYRASRKYALRVTVQWKKGPRVPPQGYHMRQHGKIWKNRSKKSFRTMFSDDFLKIFQCRSGGFQNHLCEDFSCFFGCPKALGSFLGWSWIDPGNFIFSWKFLKKMTQVKNFGLCFNQPGINRF